MRALLVRREDANAESLADRVLCQDVRAASGAVSFAKGRVIQSDDVPALLTLPWDELHLLRMEDGDVHEDEAGSRLAAAAAGDGIEVRASSAGHWPLAASVRGILEVATSPLRDVNAIEGICVYTLYDGQVVEEGEVVARAKITPFVLAGARLHAAERVAEQSHGLVGLRRFLPKQVGAVVQESLGERAMARFRDALGEKVHWFGSTLLEPAFVTPRAEAIAHAVTRLLDQGAHIVTIAGTKAMDALDPAFTALDHLGARMERHGVPAHPGSLFWLARCGGVPILGMPTCGLFSQATVFDLVLPRLLTGEEVGGAQLADLGHGGFLTRDMSFRFPPYRKSKDRGELE